MLKPYVIHTMGPTNEFGKITYRAGTMVGAFAYASGKLLGWQKSQGGELALVNWRRVAVWRCWGCGGGVGGGAADT